ncbi:pilin [Photobacterium indicum]|uniref:pilin n=1 Tax=Photobacterium indicum TaxID=81447 RepID=UPI003D108BF4
MKKMQKGFTLIELMIVVAVIGVLTAIAVPQYQNYVKKSELGAALATITALKVNLEDKIATDGNFPTIATADMAAELGASTTSLGVLNTAADTGSAGQIILTLASTTQNSGAKIAIARTATGSWTCLTDLAATAKAIFPKGCANGTIL